jgi:protein-disulfide isomerase
MTRLSPRRIALAAIALPLALGLVACGKKEAQPGGLSGEPIAKVAAPAGKAWADTVVKTPEGGYRMGNPDAPIKLVEYGSLTCPHCAELSEKGSGPLRDTFVASGRVSYEFRNFVRDPIDLTIALLTRCGAPESYFALTEQAFTNQRDIFTKWDGADKAAKARLEGLPPNQRLVEVARLAGLDEFFAARGIAKEQANACLANATEAQVLADRTTKQAEQYNIEGTPTFLINGESIGSTSWEELNARLQNLGAR